MEFLDETGLAELWSLIQAEDEETFAKGVKVTTGSYTGTGGTSKSLTFDFVPKFVMVSKAEGATLVTTNSAYYLFWISGMTKLEPYFVSNKSRTVTFSASGNSLTWSSDNPSAAYSTYEAQNISGAKYTYVAIG